MMTGRCFCGRVRWETSAPELWAGHCHCESCRRATSAPFTSFLGVARDAVRWTGVLAECESSQGRVRRQFCPGCGSQMAYQSDQWPEETHLYAATLDDPKAFHPQAHFHWAERVPWCVVSDDLPKYAASPVGAAPVA